MNVQNIVRVSNQLIGWLDDPFLFSETDPHCQWCGTPMLNRRRRCEVCGKYGSQTGPRQAPATGTFIEFYKPKKTIRVRRRKNVGSN